MISRSTILSEAASQGIEVPWAKVGRFVACVLSKVANGVPLPVAVARCALELIL